MRVNGFDRITEVLLIIGGLNWGLVGFFNYNLVDAIFGAGSTLSRIIYSLVGLSAAYMIYGAVKITRGAQEHHLGHPAPHM